MDPKTDPSGARRSRIGVALLIALASLGSRPVAAHPAQPPPASLGRDARTWISQDEWHVHLGDAYRDTVLVSPEIALLAATAALENDRWALDSSPVPVTRLLTQWKPIRNILFRMFSGKAFGRVFVDVRPLPRHRTEIRFQGGLATHRDIEHNPALGFATRSYASAVRVWQQEVRDWIARQAASQAVGR